ncbi:MAG: hypothetical protein ACK5NT_02650 [Pyrinomonadaceae bacterium]
MMQEKNGEQNLQILEILAKINLRLDEIESKLDAGGSLTNQTNHPSGQKFALIEEIATRVFDSQANEKTCAFEPNGKPCDKCSMCNTRGF